MTKICDNETNGFFQIECRVDTCFADSCDTVECPAGSLPLIPVAKITTEGSVSILEGEEAWIFFMFTLPPSLMCNRSALTEDDTCEIHISAIVELDGDVSCIGGSPIPQALIGYSEYYDESIFTLCGLKVTDSNWYMEFLLPLVATVDRLVDGDQVRSLFIYQQLMIASTTQVIPLKPEELVDVLEVSEPEIHVKLFTSYVSYDILLLS